MDNETASGNFAGKEGCPRDVDGHDDHASDVLAALSQMRIEKLACDFSVKSGDKSFFVHRNLLASCSGYFKAMFSHETQENNEGEVEVKEIDAEIMQNCIDFMYTGRVEIDDGNSRRILHAAVFLQMERLAILCDGYVNNHLTDENCLVSVELGKTLARDDVSAAARKFVFENFREVIETPEFSLLTYEDLTSYVKYVTDDELCWRAAQNWIRHDYDARKPLLLELMTHLIFRTFPASLLQEIWRDDVIQESEPCKQVIKKHLFSRSDVLKDNIDSSNCFIIQVILRTDDSEESFTARSVVQDFMLEHFDEVMGKEEFLQLTWEEASKILTSEKAVYLSEKRKWKVALKWINHNPKYQREALSAILESLKFQNLPKRFIKENVLSEPMVVDSHECSKIAIRKCDMHHKPNCLAVWYKGIGALTSIHMETPKQSAIAPPAAKNAEAILSADGVLCMICDKRLHFYTKLGCWKAITKPHIGDEEASSYVCLHDSVYAVSKSRTLRYDLGKAEGSDFDWDSRDGCQLGAGFCVAATPSRLYAIGGTDTINTAVTYDPTDGVWRGIRHTLQRRVHSAAAVLQEKVYVMGGTVAQQLNSTSGSSVAQPTASKSGGFFFGRNSTATTSQLASLTSQNISYVPTTAAEYYDPSVDQWTAIAHMLVPRSRFSACGFGGRLIVSSGPNSIEIYDPAWGVWSQVRTSGTNDNTQICVYQAGEKE